MTSKSWKVILFALGIIAFNLVLKMWFAADPSFYLDEAYSVFHSQQTIPEIMALMEREANPPLYYIILHYWMELVGQSPSAVRSLSVLASALTAGGIFWFGKRYFHFGVGVIASLLFTFSNVHLHFAQEARGFSFVLLWQITALWFFTRAVKDHKKTALIWLTIANTLLLYTHYTSAFAILVQVLALPFFLRKDWKQYLFFGLSYLITFVACLPNWLSFTSDKVGASAKWLQAPGLSQWWSTSTILGGGLWMSIAGFTVAVIGVSLLLYHRKKVHSKPSFGIMWMLLASSIGIVIIGWLVSQWVPLFLPKYLLYASIGWFLIVGIAIVDSPLPRLVNALFLVLLMAISLWQFRPSQQKNEDWKGASAYASHYRDAQTGIILTPIWHYRSFAYYAHPEAFKDYENVFPLLHKQGVYCVKELNHDFFEYQKPEKVILIQCHALAMDPHGRNIQVLTEEGYSIEDKATLQGINITRLVLDN